MKEVPPHEVEKIAKDLGLSFTQSELADYTQILDETIGLLERIDAVSEPQFEPQRLDYSERSSGYQPPAEEDPHNAWITKCRVEGADDGPLSGMTVGLKDNINLAGVKMTNGSELMRSHVPDSDATVVTRLLEDGATILGKTNMWSFAAGASDYGPAKNPNAPEYSIGGSSSGTAAAVAAGEVDIGIGGDQGGSIRIPASFGGIVGLKPTHGLIPYTGILGIDATADYTGPMTQTVREAAMATETLAGRDGLDPRQPHDLQVESYTEALGADISGMTVAVLQEGFEHDASDPAVNAAVHDAIEEMERLGANVTEVSVPGHLDPGGEVLSLGVVFYGMGQVLKQNGSVTGQNGWYDTNTTRELGQALVAQSDDLPATVKNGLLMTEYLQRNYQGALYGKAQNIARSIAEEYDAVLEDADAMVMPTVPMKPSKPGGVTRQDLIENGPEYDIAKNTGIFNLTHHPALTVPCGVDDGAPIGMMLVGRRFDESSLFQLAHAYEQRTS